MFDYDLPKTRIAQSPVRPRERAKMLYYDRARDIYRDLKIADLPTVLHAGDLLVFNVSKVRAARLRGSRQVNGVAQDTELLILKPLSQDGQFECLIRGKNVQIGEKIIIESSLTRPVDHPLPKGEGINTRIFSTTPSPVGEGWGEGIVHAISLTLVDRVEEFGVTRFVVQVESMSSEAFLEMCERIGSLPLPPYINNPQLLGHEQELYQPILARDLGSVAAPTASLHFSQKLLDELTSKGVKQAEVVLHVGLGTFLPVRVADTDDHTMHAEYVEVSDEVCRKINQTKASGGRVIAVGTTVARALESAVISNINDARTPQSDRVVTSNMTVRQNGSNSNRAFTGETSLFIQPGYEFKIIDGLLTNFHMPKSTLLMMVSAFVGREKLFELYQHALESNYRFLSFGDCMLLV